MLCLFGRQQQQHGLSDPIGNDDDQDESCSFRLMLSSPSVDRVAIEPEGPWGIEMTRELHGSLVDTNEDDLLHVARGSDKKC
jgi:hypothetical protein